MFDVEASGMKPLHCNNKFSVILISQIYEILLHGKCSNTFRRTQYKYYIYVYSIISMCQPINWANTRKQFRYAGREQYSSHSPTLRSWIMIKKLLKPAAQEYNLSYSFCFVENIYLITNSELQVRMCKNGVAS
jgi:hypothetical protein